MLARTHDGPLLMSRFTAEAGRRWQSTSETFLFVFSESCPAFISMGEHTFFLHQPPDVFVHVTILHPAHRNHPLVSEGDDMFGFKRVTAYMESLLWCFEVEELLWMCFKNTAFTLYMLPSGKIIILLYYHTACHTFPLLCWWYSAVLIYETRWSQ